MIKKESLIQNKKVEIFMEEFGKYLTFSVLNQIYCIKLNSVSEMIKIRGIKEAEYLPVFVKGVINLRGEIIPVIDLIRLQYNLNLRDNNNWNYIVIVKVRNTYVGLKVDSILKIVNLNETEIESLPHFCTSVLGIGKLKNKSKILLDIEDVFSQKELTIIYENIQNEIKSQMK